MITNAFESSMRTCELCGIKSSEYRNTSRGIWCKDCANECPGFSECKQIIRPSDDFAPYCKQCVAKCETCLEIITPYRNKKDYFECYKCERKRAAVTPPFCPQCGALGFPDSKYVISCTNYICVYVGPIFASKNSGKPYFISRSMAVLNERREFSQLDYLVKNLEGYFVWPTTEINPKWYGYSCHQSFDRVEKTPMLLIGYNVNQQEYLTEKQRQKLLTYCFKSSILPWSGNEEYMMNWGPASSPIRLKRMANHMARMGRDMRRKKYEKALGKYDLDLSFLKREYYNSMFKFEWPTTNDDL
jgi:hypothetical protein